MEPSTERVPSADKVRAAARRARVGWRRFDAVAVELPGRMFAAVAHGSIQGFGVEPVGDVLVGLDGRTHRLAGGARGHVDRVRVALAAATAGTLATAGSLAFALARRPRRA
jgi:hypothetical protein